MLNLCYCKRDNYSSDFSMFGIVYSEDDFNLNNYFSLIETNVVLKSDLDGAIFEHLMKGSANIVKMETFKIEIVGSLSSRKRSS